jgi:hypothetical protein
MSKASYERLLEALELHLNILFAEQQAISARDLATVEQILGQKDTSMDLLMRAKKDSDSNYPPEIQSRISNVLSQQAENTSSFRKLHIQADSPNTDASSTSPFQKRMKQAYSN